MKLKLPVIATLVMTLTLLTVLPFITPRQPSALPGPSDGVPTPGVDSPSNVWSPYGPYVNRLQLNFYLDETVMFTEFKAGHLDLTDWPTFRSDWPNFDTSGNIIHSVTQGEFGMFEIDFNLYAGPGDNRWANAYNCNFDHGNSMCGIAIRQGFTHLFDRQTWVNVGPAH